MKKNFDCVVIGAGPAGLSAAITARKFGLSVRLIDEQNKPGGQIYRGIESPFFKNHCGSDEEYAYGESLTKEFRASGAQYLPGVLIWQASQDGTISYLENNVSVQCSGKRIIIASGAMERPVPIPGWTLPGVMGAGAADALYKSSDIIPEGKVVLCGNGPLLLSVASKFIELGVSIEAILETMSYRDYIASIRHLPKATKNFPYLLKGFEMRRQIMASKTKVFTNVKNISAVGNEQLEKIRFTTRGISNEISVDTLLLHDGVIPNTQLTRQLNCKHEWNEVQRYWYPNHDQWGNTNIKGFLVAGDTTLIRGAKIAMLKGQLAGIEVAHQLNIVTGEERKWKAKPVQSELKREMSVRPLMDHLFKPNPEFYAPGNKDTLVCRCEEVSVAQILDSVSLGAIDPNQVKSQVRCGMGNCQGRMCGSTISELIAKERSAHVSKVGYLSIRPPLKPISVKILAEQNIFNE
jgi:thioredoxin reductase/bacterioferritin-associated ferredoxin